MRETATGTNQLKVALRLLRAIDFNLLSVEQFVAGNKKPFHPQWDAFSHWSSMQKGHHRTCSYHRDF